MRQSFGVKVLVTVAFTFVAAAAFLIFAQVRKQNVQTASTVEILQQEGKQTIPNAPETQKTIVATTNTATSSSVATPSSSDESTNEPKPSETTQESSADVQAQRPIPSTQSVDPTNSQPSTSDSTVNTKPSASASGLPTISGIGPIEAEIFRLTNAYRADPTGPLARPKPLPICNREQTTIANIQALPTLKLDTDVSLNISRAWSQQMSSTLSKPRPSKADLKSALVHSDDQWRAERYKKLGIDGPSSRGPSNAENILVFYNHRQSTASTKELAKKMFEGWRDSDGHFCAIVNSSFTHLGVGHYYNAAAEYDWATQNFFVK